MGREVRRANKKVKWDIGKTWWGYLLEPVECQNCNGTGDGEECVVCDGMGTVCPVVEPFAYTLEQWRNGERTFCKPEYDWGWQLWETVSEGGPVSPVCDSPEDLARWLADNIKPPDITAGTSYETWLQMIAWGSAPSLIMDRKGVRTGVAVLGEE